MANPPFNVNKFDKAKLEGDRRYPFGLPKAANAQPRETEFTEHTKNLHE
jgi:hypothetical protein